MLYDLVKDFQEYTWFMLYTCCTLTLSLRVRCNRRIVLVHHKGHQLKTVRDLAITYASILCEDCEGLSPLAMPQYYVKTVRDLAISYASILCEDCEGPSH